MAKVVKFLKSRIFLGFLGLVFLSLAIWFIGPLLGYRGYSPLESSYYRLMAIGSMSGFYLLTIVWRFIKSRRKNAQMLDSLAEEQGPSANETASAEEIATLQAKMQEAVDTLKGKNFSKSGGSRFIYELPWYIIIGPPGAGKTTLLSNSGLDFPLEETHGKFSVKGVGGTRNCDWWFTDQAVLLDTAGRYTTQDSEAEVDKSAWDNFLALLKNKRPRRPLNGVMIALSIQDIVESDADSLTQMAKTIRTRVGELYKALGISPPIYLMFTKCDLLAGFSEFFSDLDNAQRNQVWGFTLPLNTKENQEEIIRTELISLEKTINAQSIGKLHRELNQRNRENIYSFPMQFKFVQNRIQQFAETLTAESKLLDDVFFRGMYFTSATQTGSALDQVISNVSSSFGINNQLTGGQSGTGKSFFINQMLTEVMFSESGLAGSNRKAESRLKFLQIGAGSVLALSLLGALGAWAVSYQRNQASLERVEASSEKLIDSLNLLPADSVDLVEANVVLNNARELSLGALESENNFLRTGVGLDQSDTINDPANRKYDELLIDVLLPRLIVRLEHQMHAEVGNSEFLFEALKTYQMIDDREHFDSDSVKGWFNFDIDQNLPADTSAEVRESLKSHVARLFRERPFRLPRPLDRELVKQFQEIASAVSIEQRAYNRIKNSNAANLNTFFPFTEKAGDDITLVFNRSDDVSLDQSIPSFFTDSGYRKVFLPASKNITSALAEDDWVLGDFESSVSTDLSNNQLEENVKRQYFDEYIENWDTLIANMQLKKVDGLDEAAEFISLISDADSPLKKMLTAIASETELTKTKKDDKSGTDNSASTDREGTLGNLLGGASNSAANVLSVEIDPVTEHYKPLRKLVANTETNSSQLDSVLQQMKSLNDQLLQMAQSPGGEIDPKLTTELNVSLQKLETKSGRAPEPLASLVKGLSNEVNDVVGGGFCKTLDSKWKADVFGFYQRAIRGRYPVNRKASTDVALSDFGAFFGPGGIIDTYVDTYLASNVSKTPKQWTWVGKGAVCLSDNMLKQLAFADDIKNTFFSTGGNTPSFRFNIATDRLTMAAEIDQLTMDIGSNQMQYFHGPVKGSTAFVWPAQDGNTTVNLRVEPVVPGTSSSVSLNGPWAALRLFDQGQRKSRSGGLTVNYSFGGRPVSLTMTTSSFNPLNSVAVRNFRAPENI